MTSKALFFNLLLQELKQKVWLVALSVLTFFIALPLTTAIYMERINNTVDGTVLRTRFLNSISHDYVYLILLAVVCGLSLFGYLFSRKKVDMYHSLPVRRELYFTMKTVTAVLIFLVPYLTNLVLACIVGSAKGILIGELVPTILCLILVHLLGFLSVFLLSSIAVLLTGQLAVSLVLLGLIMVYPSLLLYNLTSCFEIFFLTYFPISDIMDRYLQTFSPIARLVGLLSLNYSAEVPFLDVEFCVGVLGLFLMTALGFLLSFYFFRHRPMEAAGTALAFHWCHIPARFLGALPLSIYCAVSFVSFSSSGSTYWGWFFFGLCFGFLLSWTVIDIIIHLDFRKVFSHVRQMAVCAAFLAGIIVFFIFDLAGYDSYQPGKDRIQSMGVLMPSYLSDYGEIDVCEKQDELSLCYSSQRTLLKDMEITEFSELFSFAEEALNHSQTGNPILLSSLSDIGSDTEYDTILVRYTLKSGRSIYRCYYCPAEEELRASYCNLYNMPEYKEFYYGLLQLPESWLAHAYLTDSLGTESRSLSETESCELFLAYCADLRELMSSDLKTDYPIGYVSFSAQTPENQTYDCIAGTYPVYPRFSRTIGYMQAHGLDLTAIPDLTGANISSVIVSCYLPEDSLSYAEDDLSGLQYSVSKEDYKKYYSQYAAIATLRVTDSSELQQLAEALVSSEYNYRNDSLLPETVSRYTVEITLTNTSGTLICHFKKGAVPSFVTKQLSLEK